MPDFTRIFAESGLKNTIGDTEYDGGWDDIVGSNPPSYKDFNSIMNEQDSKLADIAQTGVVYWDATIPYQAKALARSTVDDEIYQLLPSGDPTNEPSASPADWSPLVGDAVFPVSSIIAIAANSVPSGFLECDGSAISRTTYSVLFSLIGTVYGIGNGSTTFNIPDLRSEFVRGWDNGRGVDSGRSFGSLQLDDFKAHSHNITVYGTDTTLGAKVHGASAVNTSTASTQSAGGTETRPRNIAMLYCIKY